MTVSLSLSFSTVSNAEVSLDSASHEQPLPDSDSEESELEIEIYETTPMVEASPFLLLVFLDQHVISAGSLHLFDSFINKIEIPPSQLRS